MKTLIVAFSSNTFVYTSVFCIREFIFTIHRHDLLAQALKFLVITFVRMQLFRYRYILKIENARSRVKTSVFLPASVALGISIAGGAVFL